jgi:ubiquinone/menaquinone biosynthesis C-methylase UbiE
MIRMMKRIPIFLWLAIAFLTAGCSGLAKVDVGRVLTSGRDGWQFPDKVIASLSISKGDHVAEIGSGSGYWLPWLSEAVRDDGRVYAVEVEAELVADLESLVDKKGLHNVEVILGGYDDPRLPEASVDLAVTILTYHHIEQRVDYFSRLHRILRVGGRVAHLDDRPDAGAPFSWFQSNGHWVDPALVDQEMASAGYEKTAEFDFLPVQSFQIFGPTASAKLGGSAEVAVATEDEAGS